MHDEVGAVGERVLVDGCREGVVDRHQRVAAGRHDGVDVDDVEPWVGGCLDPDQTRVVADRARQRVRIGLVDEVVAEAPAGHDLVDQAVGAAVQVGR